MLLGEILVEMGKVSREQVAAALEKQRVLSPPRRLGEILMEDRLLAEEDLLQALGRQFGLASVASVGPDMLDPTLVARLPVEWARTQVMLPVRLPGRLPGVLLCDPAQLAPLDDLALLLGCDLTAVLAPRHTIQRAIEMCYFQKKDTAEDLLKDMQSNAPAVVESSHPANEDLLRKSDQAPVAQLVNVVLLEAVKAGASDIHIEPFEKRLTIRYRIDGFLYEQSSPQKSLEAALVSRLKVMAKLDIAEKRLPQDGAARVHVGERELDIRVSTIPVAEGERVVLRLLNRESALMPLSELGMPPDVLAKFRGALTEPHGVILVTGPTGSGKTTTLYASLQELDTRRLNVLTIEDPIEYQLPGIGQMQVKPKIGLTFAQGLRHILRQDPDVILVGETRDLETAEIVVRASLTGHLVFSTLHTNDAAGAVVRLADMGVPPYLLASALRAAMAQRLVRKLCPLCREPAEPAPDEISALGCRAARFSGRPLWRSRGCPACLGGFKGRTAMYELLVAAPNIQEAIRESRPAEAIFRLAEAHGMKSLVDDGLDKALGGETTLAEVLRAVGRNTGDSA